MTHAPRCDCFDCLPGVPAKAKRNSVTRRDPRVPFKHGNSRVRLELKRWREKAGLSGVVNA